MITFYNATFDEFDLTKNGGDPTTQIESGVAESFIKHVRPYIAEFGGERWFKFFIKSDIDIITVGVDIAKPTTSSTEEVYIGIGKDTNGNVANYESDADKTNFRAYGGFVVSAIDTDNKKITADRDISNFVKTGDIVTFYGSSLNRLTAMKVTNVSTTDITIDEWSDVSIAVGNTGASSLFIDSLAKDTNQAIWLKQEIPEHTTTMEDPADEFDFNVWYDAK